MFTNEESGACLPGACAADCGRCENSCHQVRSQTCIGVKVTTISGNGGMPEERFMGGEAESPDVLGAEGLVGAVLGLEDDGGLDDLEAVPGARGDVHPVAALVTAEPQARGLTAAVVVEHHVYLPTQQQLGLGGAAVPVHGDLRPALQRVQHPLRTVRGRVAQVAVHPQPRRRLGLSGQGVKKGVVNQHRSVFVFVFAAVLVAGSPCAQVFLMEMVVLLHEYDVGRAEHKQHAAEVSPADTGSGS